MEKITFMSVNVLNPKAFKEIKENFINYKQLNFYKDNNDNLYVSDPQDNFTNVTLMWDGEEWT